MFLMLLAIFAHGRERSTSTDESCGKFRGYRVIVFNLICVTFADPMGNDR